MNAAAMASIAGDGSVGLGFVSEVVFSVEWVVGGGSVARCFREKRARKRCASGVVSVVRVLRRARTVGSATMVGEAGGVIAEGAIFGKWMGSSFGSTMSGGEKVVVRAVGFDLREALLRIQVCMNFWPLEGREAPISALS